MRKSGEFMLKEASPLRQEAQLPNLETVDLANIEIESSKTVTWRLEESDHQEAESSKSSLYVPREC